MSAQWNGDAAFLAIQHAAAVGLMKTALAFEIEHRQRVAVPNPPPYTNSSKAGEYMRLRTGGGQKALAHEPATVAEVEQTHKTRVGFRQGDGEHMLILELARQRLGLLKTLEDMRPTLAATATAEFKA